MEIAPGPNPGALTGVQVRLLSPPPGVKKECEMSRLNEGVEFRRIYWDDGFFEVGDKGVESIVVSMENGQMAGVPWALVSFTNGEPHLVNLSLAGGVVLKEE